jgi:hypothetical protein
MRYKYLHSAIFNIINILRLIEFFAQKSLENYEFRISIIYQVDYYLLRYHNIM